MVEPRSGLSLNCRAPAAVVLMYWYGSLVLDQVSVLVFPLPDLNVGRTGIGGVNPRSLVIFIPTLDITCLTPSGY